MTEARTMGLPESYESSYTFALCETSKGLRKA